MKTCVSTARISILVNGSPTEEFSPQWGLRQDDPLSPFLFNIVAEGLNILLVRALNLGSLKGVSLICHLIRKALFIITLLGNQVQPLGTFPTEESFIYRNWMKK